VDGEKQVMPKGRFEKKPKKTSSTNKNSRFTIVVQVPGILYLGVARYLANNRHIGFSFWSDIL
jgi:hypothetical protein